MNHLTFIEPLEARIAPAMILNPYTVTYQDGDGDTAIVKFSQPLFKSPAAAAKILIFTDNNNASISEKFTGNDTAENLAEIDLLGRTAAQDMNISVKVVPQVGVGNLQVNVGDIAAANFSVANQVTQNIDLGSIYIQGNLGSIQAGDQYSTPGIKSLTVLSMDVAANSDVLGAIQNLDVKGDFNANLDVINYQFGNINKLTIGGSLAGDSAGDSGSGVIQFTGHIGSATIGNITGGAGADSGELLGPSAFATRIGTLHVLGSITGGAGQNSGRVFAQSSIGKVIVDGGITGGAGQDSGEISGPLGTVKIAGSLTGGSGISSGTILSQAFNTASTAVPLPIGHVTIGGDVVGGTAGVAASTGSATPGDSGIILGSTAKSITIAGSLIGGTAGTSVNSSNVLDQTADTSGDILVNSVKALTIGKNITGGSGPNSGIVTGEGISTSGGSDLFATMHYGSIVVHGGVTGGAGAISGSILVNGLFSGSISSVQIDGNLTGSSGTQSGEVLASTGLANLLIGGSVTGGAANDTGEISTSGVLSSGTIKGGITGSSSGSTKLTDTGYLQAGGIGTLTVGGALTSGTAGSGGLDTSGAIRSSTTIGSITVGSVVGNATEPAVISAVGLAKVAKNATTDVAIQNVTIIGDTTYGDILAGYNSNTGTSQLGTGVNADAQIGTVTIGGNLSATNIVAGVGPGTSGFGTSGSAALSGSGVTNLASIVSKISSIIVKGSVTPTASATDSYGIAAQYIVSATVDGAAEPLIAQAGNDTFAQGRQIQLPAASGDVFLYEVGL